MTDQRFGKIIFPLLPERFVGDSVIDGSGKDAVQTLYRNGVKVYEGPVGGYEEED